ncbi:MAG: hypothetical protein AAFU77_05270 [Myxococcota bacterium]
MRSVITHLLLCSALAVAGCSGSDSTAQTPDVVDTGDNENNNTGGNPVDQNNNNTGEIPDTCTNGVIDPNESDVDCGGDCDACTNVGDTCIANRDCGAGLSCGDDSQCDTDSCENGLADGDESDVDCGGSCATRCSVGDSCNTLADCADSGGRTTRCLDVCLAPACNDLFANGDEGDTDCGGSCPERCEEGDACLADADCPVEDVRILVEGATFFDPAPEFEDTNIELVAGSFADVFETDVKPVLDQLCVNRFPESRCEAASQIFFVVNESRCTSDVQSGGLCEVEPTQSVYNCEDSLRPGACTLGVCANEQKLVGIVGSQQVYTLCGNTSGAANTTELRSAQFTLRGETSFVSQEELSGGGFQLRAQ